MADSLKDGFTMIQGFGGDKAALQHGVKIAHALSLITCITTLGKNCPHFESDYPADQSLIVSHVDNIWIRP